MGRSLQDRPGGQGQKGDNLAIRLDEGPHGTESAQRIQIPKAEIPRSFKYFKSLLCRICIPWIRIRMKADPESRFALKCLVCGSASII